MNLWAKKIKLALLVPALLLFSCEEDVSTIGLDPENNLGIFFVEIPLADKVTQVWVDEVNSGATANLLVGNTTTNSFGRVQAQNFSEIIRNTAIIPDSGTFDSLVLELRIASITGPNGEGFTERFEVYQIDTIDRSEPKFTSSSQALGRMIGEARFALSPDSINLNLSETNLNAGVSEDSAFIANRFDENQVYIYQHRFRLDETFGQEVFEELQDISAAAAVDRDSLFREFFGGVALLADAGNNSMIAYDGANQFSRITLYYSVTNTNGAVESRGINYGINSFLSYNNISPNANTPWSGSDFDELVEFYSPLETSNGRAYLQSGTNLLMKVDVSDLTDFGDTVDTYIIQNAEFVIKGLENVNQVTPPPPSLLYYLTTEDSLTSENYSVGVIPFDTDFGLQNARPLVGFYDDDNNEYRTSIPRFLQISTDSLALDQIVIAPAPSLNGVLIENSIVRGFVVPKENISIRFFYTIPEQN